VDLQNSLTAANSSKFPTKTILGYPDHTLSMLLHYLGKLKNQKFAILVHKTRFKCDFLSFIQQMSAKCHENKCKD